MLNRAQRWICVVLTATLICANCSCSYYARVPREAYHNVEAGDSTRWKIETDDGRDYLVSQFTLTDSTLVIEAFDPSVKSPEETYPLVTAMPYTIDLDQVRSIKKLVEVSEAQGLLITAIVPFVIIIAFLIWLAHSLEEGPGWG